MLVGLSIRDIVLIERLDLELRAGLCVVTGETGAGKSILLDALGLALGDRADSGLVRQGVERGSVAASFALDAEHPALALLRDQGLDSDPDLVLRRTITAEGRSRAFANDQPISVALLRNVGDTLVEIHGQAHQSGPRDPASQRTLVDAFGRLRAEREEVSTAWEAVRAADEALRASEAALLAAREEEDFIRHAVNELGRFAPVRGEEGELAATRKRLMEADQITEAIEQALSALGDDDGPRGRLRLAARSLGRVSESTDGRLDDAQAALGRALVETDEAIATISSAASDLRADEARLEQVEERLFTLRALARKHRVDGDGLPDLRDALAGKLAALENAESDLEALTEQAAAARRDYRRASDRLSAARHGAADRLDVAVADELGPLKLGHATFKTQVMALAEGQWGREGADSVAFHVTTIPGTSLAPLARIASGGELSRLSLGLKVVLSRSAGIKTMIFDEVDRDVGGATADAVGQRLAALAEQGQVIVITHSPQVAARAGHHWRATKTLGANGANEAHATVELLDAAGRREEVARMLAGAQITEAARAAADNLIQGHGP